MQTIVVRLVVLRTQICPLVNTVSRTDRISRVISTLVSTWGQRCMQLHLLLCFVLLKKSKFRKEM